MATRTSTTAGDWSNGGTWVGGVAPVDGDKAVINHVVTVDDTSRACGVDGATDSILIGAAGTLKWSRAANSLLTVRGQIKLNAAGAQFDMGKVGDEIPGTYTAGLVLNKHAGSPGHLEALSSNGALSSYGFYIAGDTSRNRVAVLTSSVTAGSGKTFTVDDATGWQIGDEVLVGHSDASNPAAARYEVITLTAIAPLTANFAYGHLSGCFAGNLESNVEISSFSSANPAAIRLQMSALTAQTIEVRNARFVNLGRFANGQGGFFLSDGATGSNIISPVKSFHANVSHYDGTGYNSPSPLTLSGVNRSFTVTDWVSHTPAAFTGGNAIALNGDKSTVDFENCLVCSGNLFYSGINVPWEGSTFRGGQICVSSDYISPGPYASGSKFVETIISGYGIAFGVTQNPATLEFERCDLGFTHGWNAKFGDNFFRLGGTSNALLRYKTTDCVHSTDFAVPTSAANLANLNPATRCEYVNKGGDLTQQEIYLYCGTVIRENTLLNRGTSSLKMQPTKLAADTKHTTNISATDGEAVRVVGYCRFDTSFYNANDYTAPTVKILTADGTVLATYTATSAANGAWEKFDITGTNTTGADANLTIEFTANAKTVTTGKVYFDGVAVSPFVTKCRHYGFLFDESNPKRVINATVSANEATAAAYSGMSVTWGASTSDVEITADTTFQKLYDYTQAQGCLNIASAMPITGAGLAGNPVLFAQGAVEIDPGFKLSGSGSLSMGVYTLIADFGSGDLYAYTGGAYSQASTVPTFGGGELEIGDTGSYVFGSSGTLIVKMNPTAPGTYAMGGVTASGTLDLRNETPDAITVELAGGVAYTTANNTGGTITVDTPQLYQSVTITGAVAGSRIQIYDTDTDEELYNGTPSFPHTWTDADPAAADRPIRLRVARVDGDEAMKFIEANIGTCGQTAETAAIGYLVNQVADATYNTNAIDGPAVYASSGITFTDDMVDRVNCNIPGGGVTWPTIYACFVYWLSTSTGIADDIAYVDAPNTADYLLNNMQIRNTNATPLTITGGYGRDATTGLVADVIDVAGSTGNIYPAPDHVVPFSTGSGLTSGQDAKLTAIASATGSSGQVNANIVAVNDIPVEGSGTEGEPWGPAP